MKIELLNSELITKEMAMNELNNSELSKEEIDEYLDIITAINEGQSVYNITTNHGDYLFFIKCDAIKNTIKRIKE